MSCSKTFSEVVCKNKADYGPQVKQCDEADKIECHLKRCHLQFLEKVTVN